MVARDQSAERAADYTVVDTETRMTESSSIRPLGAGVKKSPLGIALFSSLLLLWIGWLVYLAIRLNF